MGERRGTRGLELWCRRMTDGYPGVKIDNMTTSWRDGLAFCAIIHHFRPDLIDFSKLNKDDIYHNNELAFRIAEHHLGIPALLEPEDMVEFPVPDRLSILTYLSQFYQTFAVTHGTAATRIPAKRPQPATDHGIVSPASTSPPTKISVHGTGRIRREPCAKCNLPVFIAERLNVGKQLYHRTCFRCARCESQLTLANYYETENGQYCCEMCPDEEKLNLDDNSVLSRSISDEEKSALSKMRHLEDDSYSSVFEEALENPYDNSLKKNSTLTMELSAARSQFFESQVLQSETDSGNEEPPDLPKTAPPGDNESIRSISAFDSGFPTTNKLELSVNNSVSLEDKFENIVTKDHTNRKLFDSDSKSDSVHNDDDLVPLELPDDSPLDCKHSKDDNNEISTITISDDSVELVLESKTVNNHSTLSDDNSLKTVEDLDESIQSIKKEFDTSTPNEKQDDDKPVDIREDEDLDESIVNCLNTVEDLDESIQSINKEEPKEKQEGEDNSIDVKEETQESIEVKVEEPPEIVVPKPRKNKKKLLQKEVSYPEDLNPFGDDEPEETPPKTSLNPFGEDEDEDEDKFKPTPSPRAKRKIRVDELMVNTPESRIYTQRQSVNPFDDEEEKPLAACRKKVIEAPRISLNPFWSEDEDEGAKMPVPTPRVSVESGATTTSSSSHLGSTSSQPGTLRKKKPAPKPPGILRSDASESGHSSLTSSPSQSIASTPRLTPKNRKAKKAAPPPPVSSSTPLPPRKSPELDSHDLDKEKSQKDEMNRHRQSQNFNVQSPTSSENSSSLSAPNKSTYGKWKRNKGQAPQRPIPQKRTIKALPMGEIKRELEVIEIQQQGLEKQGVMIEQIIRDKSENNSSPDEPLSLDVEDLILQLFELVNEKNELFRKQTELMYLRRQQRLEEEHADVEYQIRLLMLQPEANKTASDKSREEELISRLVDIVERKNEIIECLEMDRLREAQEDDSINNQMNIYTAKLEEEKSPTEKPKKEKNKHKITREKIREKLHILKDKDKKHKVDIDKDIDESEHSSMSTLEKDKEKKKKKKFNIF
ncbi:unnamed protein product [Brassicogethes aeneus]|uniref:MICAL-like protein 1 n=1 Tax=Brassicogethes aeneus TaxID=1431903 RepID=A0A9P0B3V5_BRAAE|nr:unnamed protein product [Brassicogethes aeneus]